MHTLRALFLVALIVSPFHADAAQTLPASKEISLFDGKTLNGWQGDAVWRVQDGAIVGDVEAKALPYNSYLCTTAQYRNFTLHYKVKLEGFEGFVNSGVQFRSQRLSDREIIGYQADVGSEYWGNIYDEHRRNTNLGRLKVDIAPIVRVGDWNEMQVYCQGELIQVSLNGVLISQWVETDRTAADRGVIGLQVHAEGRLRVSYKEIILESRDPERDVPADNLGFELGDLSGWTATGNAFTGQPIEGNTVTPRKAMDRAGLAGDFWIGGWERMGDSALGTLTSDPISVTKPWASFRIGGGAAASTRVELLAEPSGEVIFSASGQDKEEMSPVTVDLSQQQGGEIRVRLVDENEGGWGHINFDDFKLWATAEEAAQGAGAVRPDPRPRGYVRSEHAVQLPPVPAAGFDKGFELRDEDIIALIGGANIEVENDFGWLETGLRLRNPAKRLHVRNLGWEGDTVYTRPRDVEFGSLTDHLLHTDAGLVILQFGQAESLDASQSLDAFSTAYAQLIDEVQRVTRRVLILSPLCFEQSHLRDGPDLLAGNARVREYRDAIAKLARVKQCLFVDLIALQDRADAERLTRDGIHLHDRGQKWLAEAILRALGMPVKANASAALLRRGIQQKNALWVRHYRPENYAFAFGDRAQVPFSEGRQFSAVSRIHADLVAHCDAQLNAMMQSGKVRELTFKAPPVFAHSQGLALTPEEQRETIQFSRDDLQANIFASEEDGIINPVRMTWDERGRLWVVCLPDYPQADPGQDPADYILICEDRDGDGRADHFTRFAEGLNLPGGLALVDGGAYVANGRKLIFLKDRDGDDKADTSEVILSGFGMGDTHQCINSVELAMDGSLWFSQGLHIFSFVETSGGVKRLFRSGLWRYNRHSGDLAPIFSNAKGGVNCWGIQQDRWGNTFHVSGGNFRVYDTELGLINHPSDDGPGIEGFAHERGNKKCGAEIIESAHFPDDLQGTALFAEYVANRIVAATTSLDSGSWTGPLHEQPLVWSQSPVFRPVDIQHGPDGALYIADWYNEIIGHYQSSYRDPRRDKTRGRIWRVTAKDRPLVKRPDFSAMSPADLLGQLGLAESWPRLQARRLLMSMPRATLVAALDQWQTSHTLEHAIDRNTLVQVLGLYVDCNHVNEALLAALLESEDVQCRRAAIRAVASWAMQLKDTAGYLRRGVQDDDARMRVLSLTALSYWRRPEAVEIAMLATDRPMHASHNYVLERTVKALAALWVPALARGVIEFDGDNARKIAALRLIPDGERQLLSMMRQAYAERADLTASESALVIAALCRYGDENDIANVLAEADSPQAIETALETIQQRRLMMPMVSDEAIEELFIHRASTVRAGAVAFIGSQKRQSYFSRIHEMAKSDTSEKPLRLAAVAALGDFGDREQIAFLLNLSSDPDRDLALAALRALVQTDLRAGAARAAGLIAGVSHADVMKTVLKLMSETPPRQEALAAATQNAGIDAAQATAIYKSLTANGISAPQLSLQMQALMAQGNQPETRSIATWVELVKAQGRADAGKALFTQGGCAACHAIDGKGGVTGPDLSTVGRSYPADQVIESVLKPNAVVKEGFDQVSVALSDGRTEVGFLASSDPQTVTLKNPATGEQTHIKRPEVTSITSIGSPMPEGLLLAMSEQQKLDLLAYLTSLGIAARK